MELCKYREQHKVIAVDASKMDVKNYELDNVLSLTSLLNKYYPATTSNGTIKNLESKGMDGLTEQYFPPDLQTIESQQYCPGGSCVFRHNSSSLVGILNNFRGSDFNQSNFLLVT